MAKVNLISALVAFTSAPTNRLAKLASGTSNRAQSMGETLEVYVKTMLSEGMQINSKSERIARYADVFSYTGNANNPPDIMYRGGDAFEVKKVQSIKSSLALNSSHPKNKLYSSDSKISNSCRSCEDWNEKDIFYVVGHVKKGESKVRHLWFVHGECYAADKNFYQSVVDDLTSGIESIDGITFTPTNELAKVNEVDPLGITYLRVRGMWGIDNPIELFDYIYEVDLSVEMSIAVIMTSDKYDGLSKGIEIPEDIILKSVEIQNPNNPADLLDAKLLTFKF